MSKASPPPERVELNFNLFDLPTAQHKAGLAGLLLQIQAMNDRRLDERNPGSIPAVEFTRSGARIVFTEASLQGLFQDLYAAKLERVGVINKWPGAELKDARIEEEFDPKTKKMKQVRRFYYDVVNPTAPLLERHLDSGKDSAWLKLWRKMIWEIPRGINTTRAPFNEMAARGESEEKGPAKFISTIWSGLLKFDEKRSKNLLATDSVSSALMLGAQDVNAEVVPFQGQIDHNLLLHFWQVVVLTFRPYFIDGDDRLEPKGYVLAIPEVSDLKEFLIEFPQLLARLGSKKRGIIPEDACIDLPAQAGLEFLRSLHALVADKTHAKSWNSCVAAVDCFHMERQGNAIRMLSFERVADRPGLISQYERIQKTFRNPLFRSALLRSLLRQQPWYGEMLEHSCEYDWPLFIESEETPKYIPRFARDARAKFQAIHKDIDTMTPAEISADQKDSDRLALIVRRLVTRYVEGRAQSKTGLKVKDFDKEKIKDGQRERRIYPKVFREAQERICTDAFLAMRSRHDSDFTTFFVGSICSVAQFLPPDDYQFLTTILLRRSPANAVGPLPLCWEDVKALAMMAVSAYSYAIQPREMSQAK